MIYQNMFNGELVYIMSGGIKQNASVRKSRFVLDFSYSSVYLKSKIKHIKVHTKIVNTENGKMKRKKYLRFDIIITEMLGYAILEIDSI
jgi:hypothetical protein